MIIYLYNCVYMKTNVEKLEELSARQTPHQREDAAIDGLLESLELDFRRLNGGANMLINGRPYSDRLRAIPAIYSDDKFNAAVFREFIEQELLIPAGFTVEEVGSDKIAVSDQELLSFLKNFTQGHMFTLEGPLNAELHEDGLISQGKSEKFFSLSSTSGESLQYLAITNLTDSSLLQLDGDRRVNADDILLDSDGSIQKWGYTLIERGSISLTDDKEIQYSEKSLAADLVNPPESLSEYHTGFPSGRIDKNLNKARDMILEIQSVIKHLERRRVELDKVHLSQFSLINAICRPNIIEKAFDEIYQKASEPRKGILFTTAKFGETASARKLNAIKAKFSSFFKSSSQSQTSTTQYKEDLKTLRGANTSNGNKEQSDDSPSFGPKI